MHLDVDWVHERYKKFEKSDRLEWYLPLPDIFIDWADWRMWDMRFLSIIYKDDMACLVVESNWIIRLSKEDIAWH
jgi:hypothetical protein